MHLNVRNFTEFYSLDHPCFLFHIRVDVKTLNLWGHFFLELLGFGLCPSYISEIGSVPVLSLAFSKEPNRVGVSPFTWGWKQIQFPKSCFLWFLEYRTMDDVRNPSNSESYTPSSEPFRIYPSPWLNYQLSWLRISRFSLVCLLDFWASTFNYARTTSSLILINSWISHLIWRYVVESKTILFLSWISIIILPSTTILCELCIWNSDIK
jgi:hypothetical protein